MVIVEADELGPRSSLRQLFEVADNAAALPCYRDEAEDIARLIAEELGRAGLRLTDEARDYLVGALGGDRGVTRRELEKIVSYMGPSRAARPLKLADAVACVGDSAALSVDDLVFALGDGDLAAVERLTTRTGGGYDTSRDPARAQSTFPAPAPGGGGRRSRASDPSLKPPVFFQTGATLP